MKISAKVENRENEHHVTLNSHGREHSIDIPPKASGFGSDANGGELLFLALATCYCNDLYRAAAKRGISISAVEVEVEGDFGRRGEPARDINYRAKVTAQGSEEQIREMMEYTDQMAEILNTVRLASPVTLASIEIEAG